MGGRFVRVAAVATATVMAMAVALLGESTPALAHNSFTGSVPADGARLERPPASVRLNFLARLNPNTTRILVTGPDGTSAAGGRPVFTGNKVSVPLRARLAGDYLVAYRVAGEDGHPIEGSLRFTITAGIDTSAAPTPGIATSIPGGGSVGGGPAESPPTNMAISAQTKSTADEDDLPWWPLALAAAIVGVFGGLALAKRRRG